MKVKKIFYTALVLLLAMSVLAVSVSSVRYYGVKKGQTVDFTAGRAGIQFVKSQYTGMLKISRYDSSNAGGGIDFTQKPVDFRFVDNKGNKVTHILGAVYVHFKVRQFEQKLFDYGLITVYYFDPWFNEWKECPTFRADGALGCRMKDFGLYGLGLKH